ncbi:unnamed protein product [Ceutorhynchus assimilis]|uniref:Uncharacterized protein n=1 Tax=Ceutorhynchus assimilis TaxID=467358 RepID=A0A9N9QNQ2_9CUCU|nr:unnamed protein product [Ceutorhynchus assimilis]
MSETIEAQAVDAVDVPAQFSGLQPKAKVVSTPPPTLAKLMASLQRHLMDDNIDISPEMQESIRRFTTIKPKVKAETSTNQGKHAAVVYKEVTVEEMNAVKKSGLDASLEDLISCVRQKAKFLYDNEYMMTMLDFILKFNSFTPSGGLKAEGDSGITCRDFTYETNLMSQELKIKMRKRKPPFLWIMIHVVWELTRSTDEIIDFINGKSIWNKIESLVNSQLIRKPEDAVEVNRFDGRFSRRNLKIVLAKNKIEQVIRLSDLERSLPKITKRTREEGDEGIALFASVKRSRGDKQEEEDIKLMDITSTGYKPYLGNKDPTKDTIDSSNGSSIILCSPRNRFYVEKTRSQKLDETKQLMKDLFDEHETENVDEDSDQRNSQKRYEDEDKDSDEDEDDEPNGDDDY